MPNHRFSSGYLTIVFGLLLACAFPWIATVTAAERAQFKVAYGIAVYLGIVPAEIVKGPPPHSGERPMHGGIPRGRHEYHIVAALFDASSNARIENASITAQVSGLGLAGSSKALDPMQIAGTTTYGTFFSLPGFDLYTIKLTIRRPGLQQPVVLEFRLDHRS